MMTRLGKIVRYKLMAYVCNEFVPSLSQDANLIIPTARVYYDLSAGCSVIPYHTIV